jgi:hypothetical protein
MVINNGHVISDEKLRIRLIWLKDGSALMTSNLSVRSRMLSDIMQEDIRNGSLIMNVIW